MDSMAKKLETLPSATFRSILDEAIESGRTTRKAVGIVAEADDEMVRRWLNGQLPKLKPFKRLISPLPGAMNLPTTLQDQLVDWFLRRTGYRAARVEGFDATQLDQTSDRIVDANDTLCHTAQAIERGGAALRALCDRMKAGLNEAEKAQVRTMLYDLRKAVDLAIETLDYTAAPVMRVAQ